MAHYNADVLFSKRLYNNGAKIRDYLKSVNILLRQVVNFIRFTTEGFRRKEAQGVLLINSNSYSTVISVSHSAFQLAVGRYPLFPLI